MSLISKRHYRLYKEARIYLERKEPRGIRTVYWFDDALLNTPENSMAVRKIHDLGEIPWPSRDSLIVSPAQVDAITVLMPGISSHRTVFGRPADCVARAWSVVSDNNVSVDHETFGLVYLDSTQSDARVVDKRPWDQVIKDELASCGESGSSDHHLLEWYHGCVPSKGAWFAGDIAGMQEALDRNNGYRFSFRVACHLLASLSSIAVPSHYIVRAHQRKRYGSKKIGSCFAKDALIVHVSFDRLHQFVKERGEIMADIEPHSRRGHVHHFWKRAGLNRFALPDCPVERMLLCRKHQVEELYIPPMWIGPRLFETEELVYEVLVDPIQLTSYSKERQKRRKPNAVPQ